MERLISGLGLLVLLGIAWSLSTSRRHIRMRTVVWGVGLQFLFAVIILSPEPRWSLAAMFVLVVLVGTYVLDVSMRERRGLMPASATPIEVEVRRDASDGEPAPSTAKDTKPAQSVGDDPPALERELAARGQTFTRERVAPPPVAMPVLAGVALLVTAANGLLGRAADGIGLGHWLLGAVLVAFLFATWRDVAVAARGLFLALLGVGLGVVWARGLDGQALFRSLSDGVTVFLSLSTAGAEFLFGELARNENFFPGSEFWPGFGFQFAFVVLPTIIFFSAFMSVAYYLGIVPRVVQALARFMHWSLRTSGAETMSCSANVFVGQTEAPFLIKPFLDRMTPSELHAVMVGGFATIAGGVLAGYIGMGVDAGHLIAASVMSAPAALVIAKLLFPETEVSDTAGHVEVPRLRTADNVVDAAAIGTTDGLRLALNVGAMLIAFISLIAFLDLMLGAADGWIDGRLLNGERMENGEVAGIFPGSVRTFFGTLLAPLAFLMGVPWKDAAAVGNLLGVKLAVNEFVAYGLLGEAWDDLEPRSALIATYALCGFANFSSLGIQIGGIGALAPDRRELLSRLAPRALLGGALASFTTATVAGLLVAVPS